MYEPEILLKLNIYDKPLLSKSSFTCFIKIIYIISFLITIFRRSCYIFYFAQIFYNRSISYILKQQRSV